MRLVITSLALLFLASCAQVRTNVEVFHELPPDYVGQQIGIVAADARKADTMEFKTYGAKLAQKLVDAGFEFVGGDAQPKYVAMFDYAIGPGQQITETYSKPIYGVTGYSSALTMGTFQSYGGLGTYGGTTLLTPTYGVTGYKTGITTRTEHPRKVAVWVFDMNWDDLKSSRQVYQLLVISSGKCATLSAVIDEMLEAGFQEFPGESGESRRVTVPAKFDC